MKSDSYQNSGSCQDGCCCQICLGYDSINPQFLAMKLSIAIKALQRIESGRFLDADNIARKALNKINGSNE